MKLRPCLFELIWKKVREAGEIQIYGLRVAAILTVYQNRNWHWPRHLKGEFVGASMNSYEREQPVVYKPIRVTTQVAGLRSSFSAELVSNPVPLVLGENIGRFINHGVASILAARSVR